MGERKMTKGEHPNVKEILTGKPKNEIELMDRLVYLMCTRPGKKEAIFIFERESICKRLIKSISSAIARTRGILKLGS
jgi:hypothetical protein